MTPTVAREPGMSGARHRRLAELLDVQFGLSIDSFPRSLANLLLERLPPTLSEGDPAVLQRIVAACSIGETMFMRHAEHFAVLREIAPTLPSARAGRKLSVWSAGCATGEEAYSLAALLSTSLATGAEVLGTDVNPESITRAEKAQYGLWSLRGVDIAAHTAWLHADGLRVSVDERTRRSTRFRVLNLVKDPYPEALDIVFCRNVLLYFNEPAAQNVLERMAQSLQPGGVLFLGYTDAQPRVSAELEAHAWQGVRYYRRPLRRHDAALPVEPPDVAQAPAGAQELFRRLPFDAALGYARGLAGQGLIDEALEAVRDLCSRFPLEVEPNVLGALIAQEGDRLTIAIEFARRAGFLCPHEPFAHYLLATLFEQVGERRLAAQRFTLALSALASEPNQAVAYAGGLLVHQLRRMIERGKETAQ